MHFDSVTGWVRGVRHCPSPNFNLRPQGDAVSLLVIHNISLPPGQFGTGKVQAFFQNRLDPNEHPYFEEIRHLTVSAHFLIERDGAITQFVSCHDRAWHAGVSCFDGREACNDFSLGIEPAGAEALLLTLAEEPEVDLSVRLAELARRLREGLGEGVRDLVPGWTTLMLHYDPYRIAPQVLEERLGPLLAEWHAWRPAEDAGRLHEIPVWYAGEDLATVAVACGLTGERVIELHSAAEYRVGAIGFAPGFAYLGGLDPRLVLPRRATPRARVPAGSLAIAEAQTAIYPQASPGGWHLLGRSPWRPFDPAAIPPCPLALGDRVRFVAIGREAFLDLGGRE
ncbi:TPA: 1,6-anhydro-N-acetylmuramyl-L-alanine amidase AmpD [Pseudomonas aeruginosa]|nr:1,6-anhydro-N-acetylmuramyl-L-alanine amidase AmpD [Pseudomonas aeruginosa]